MIKFNFKRSMVVLTCFIGITNVQAQFEETAKIVSDNREGRAEYGTSVAITENYAAVGASRENIASGATYIYTKDSQGNWSYTQRLAAADPNEGAEYGGGMKFSDDYLVVAAGRANVGGLQRTGALYVYDNINGSWEFNTKIVASDYSSEAKLGMNPTSLDVEGNTIIAGAPGEDSWRGSVYVFTKVGDVWEETQKILSPTTQQLDTFGVGVSIFEDHLIIGAGHVDGRKGAAYVYVKNNMGLWDYDQTITASDGADDDFFGSSISLFDNQLVVGSYGANDETGKAYIFERNGQGAWEEVQILYGDPTNERAQYGWTTTIKQDYILVTEPHIYGYEKAKVYVYKREASGTWVQDQIIQGNDTEGEDFYGWSVDIHENELIVGSPREDQDQNGGNDLDDAGSAYIFKEPIVLGGLSDHNNSNKITVYPNPAHKNLHISSKVNTITSLKLFSIQGALIQEVKELHNNSYILNVSNYAKGVYMVSLTLDDGSDVVQKIVKI